MNRDRLIQLTLLSSLVASCAIGPSYKPVEIPHPEAFTEMWQQANPMDTEPKGPWWQLYGDTTLNELEEKAIQSNQSIRVAEAQYQAAAATVAAAHWALIPSLTFSAGSSENLALSSSSGGGGSRNLSTSTTDRVTGSVGWELDFWGQLRRGLQQAKRSAEGSANDLLAAQLSVTATLAQDYMQLRAVDAQLDLLRRTITAYQRSLTITQNRYAAGVAQRTDVTQAESQLATAQTQQAELGIQRPLLEHALAVLTGQAPENFSLAPAPVLPTLPGIAAVIPATLLERRPDVAAAERRVAAANASIGVAEGAYFPAVSLTGSSGYQSNSFHNLATLPNKVWSFGPSIAYALFDSGSRALQLGTAKASYRQSVASYRQVVLGALQDAEDQLATLHGLSIEEEAAARAALAAKETLTATENQYRAGTVSYLNVVIAESTSLATDSTLINVQSRRLLAHVGLLRAMGGSPNP